MATAAQIEANRKNARKSTGPKTDEGKARSRQNALKHGLAAVELLPEQGETAFQGRVDQLNAALKPCDDWEWHCIEMMAVLSLRVERCVREEAAVLALATERAEHFWDDDRRLDAAELGGRLAKDPEKVKLRLEQTPQGCRWLAARWKDLLDSGRRGDEERSRAANLLGLAPEAGPADLESTARAEIDRLERRAAGVLADLDDAARDLAECGMGPEVETAVRRIRRYESACLRRLEWFRAQVGKVFRPAPLPPMPPLPPSYRPTPTDGPSPGANGPNFAPTRGANEPNPAPARCSNGPNPAPTRPPAPLGTGPASLSGSLRALFAGPPAAPNRKARRAARSRAA